MTVGLSGYGNESTRIATGVDTDLGLIASVLAVTGEDGETVLIISADSASVSDTIRSKTVAKITELTGVPASNIIINSNHQHSTPVGNNDYVTLFAQNVAAAAVEALANRAPTTMYIASVNVNEGYSFSEHFNYVRNYTMLNSSGEIVGMITDNHSDATRTGVGIWTKLTCESMADDEVQLVKFVRDGASTVIMANFQTHPHLLTSGTSTIVTSDIIGVFRNTLEASLETDGTDYDVMYISGASGNINAQGNSIATGTDSTKAWAKSDDADTNMAHALLLPNRTYSAITAMGFTWTPVETGEVEVVSTVNSYQLKMNTLPSWLEGSKTVAEVEAAAAEIYDAATGTYLIDLASNKTILQTYASYYKNNYGIYSQYHAKRIVLRSTVQEGDTQAVTLSAVSIGDIAFVSAPYEMFDTNGMQIKDGSPFAMTFINTLSQVGSSATTGHLGYIPSALGYANGGYSTDITPFHDGTGEQMVADFLELLNSLK